MGSRENIAYEKNQAEEPDLMKNLTKIYVQLSVKNFATEPVLQGVMSEMYSAFDSCKSQFTEALSNSDIENKNLITNIFNNSFKSFVNSHDPKNGVLRSTFMRNTFYKQEFNFIQLIEVPILDDGGRKHNTVSVMYLY